MKNIQEDPRTTVDENSGIEEQHPSQNELDYVLPNLEPHFDPMAHAGAVEEIAKGFWFVEGPVWT